MSDRSEAAGIALGERLLAGDRRTLARLLSHVEAEDAVGRAGLTRVYPATGRGHRIGVTGPPGAGKSTLVNAVIGVYRDLGRQVGVLAIDPSSPLTGGATLGDRIRMVDRYADEGVFIRSLASRGQRGGLARATIAAAHLLDAAGFDPILIETVGAGQDEVAIAAAAHSVVVVQVPGLGDDIQTIKAGILEIGDLLVVNKADRPGAEITARDLRRMLALGTGAKPWTPPVLLTSASTGQGVVELQGALDVHRSALETTPAGYGATGSAWDERVRGIAGGEVRALLRITLERWLDRGGRDGAVVAAIADVASRRRTATDAAEALVRGAVRDLDPAG